MKKVYFENFDGIRTIAFLMVFFSHIWRNLYYKPPYKTVDYFITKLLDVGSLGVNLFFVLSGFLITYLLILEKQDHGKVNIVNFYIRRILRIWPVYYVSVLIGIFILPNLIPSLRVEFNAIQPVSFFRYLLFLVNFDHINYGIDFRWASVLWSVAVEEQFYLLWPLVIQFSNKRTLPYTLFLLIFASFAYRFFYFDSYRRINYHTFACLSDLSVGAFGAYWYFYYEKSKRLFFIIPGYINFSVYILGVLILIFRYEIFTGQYLIPFISLFGSLFFLYILLEQVNNSLSFFKLEKNTWLTQNGKYTYGLYCYHFYGIFAINFIRSAFNFNPKNLSFFILASFASLLISFLIAKISYQYLEIPFLNLKRKFSYVLK